MSEYNDPKSFPETLKKALVAHNQGQLEQAEAAYQSTLAEYPEHPVALCMSGLLLQSTGRTPEAIGFYRRASQQAPDYFDAQYNLGMALAATGDIHNALPAMEMSIQLRPDNPQCWQTLALLYRGTGDQEKAIASMIKAQELVPQSEKLIFELANLYRENGQAKSALAWYDRALNLNPDYLLAKTHKGAVLLSLDKTKEALALFEEVLKQDSNQSDAWINKGFCMVRFHRYSEAQSCFETALELNPGNVAAHSNLGMVLRVRGETEQAEHALRNALALDNANVQAHQNLSFLLFHMGRYEEALEEYEWRWKIPEAAAKMRSYGCPLWDGSINLEDKTLIIWREQGPGDITIWASVIPEIANKCKKLILSVHPKLVDIFQRSFPTVTVIGDSGVETPLDEKIDFHLPIGSLFKVLKVDPAQPDTPYLSADPERVQFWKTELQKIGPPPYVGISWKGALITEERAPNYTAVQDWAPVLALNATFINFQCGEREKDLEEFQQMSGKTIHDFPHLDLFDGLDDVCACAAALDVVISVSTAVAPLAAAVGTETWLLSWQQSPWNSYLLRARGPKVSNFCRSSNESWDAIFSELASRLGKICPQ